MMWNVVAALLWWMMIGLMVALLLWSCSAALPSVW
jgi:hypothetical protein